MLLARRGYRLGHDFPASDLDSNSEAKIQLTNHNTKAQLL